MSYIVSVVDLAKREELCHFVIVIKAHEPFFLSESGFYAKIRGKTGNEGQYSFFAAKTRLIYSRSVLWANLVHSYLFSY